MKTTYFFVTTHLGLRHLTYNDISGPYADWLNDAVVCKYNSHHRFPNTIENMRSYVNEIYAGRNALLLAIDELSSNKHIGNISLQCINYIDRNAELAFLIGDKDCWGKSYATEAGRVVIEHAFNELNLHRLYLGTADNNGGMQKVACKLGFIQEGIRKEAIYKDGIYHDILEYGLLKSTYMSAIK